MRHKIEDIQEQIRAIGADGWLIYVWRDVNPVAVGTLGLPPGGQRTRRAFYFIPAHGNPRKLQHAIEPHTLASVPGEGASYLSYTSLHEKLRKLLGDARKIAMEYSPNALIPTVSWVDGGMIELIRSFGVEIVSSAELIQVFEATLTDAQIDSHIRAGEICRDAASAAFAHIAGRLREGRKLHEYELQRFIVDLFHKHGLETDHPPIVAIDAHASDPHYSPEPGRDGVFAPGQVVLIDLWAKVAGDPASIYADQTWMGYIGDNPPARVREVWELARDARRAGYDLVASRIEAGQAVYGWEVDDAVRAPIDAAGLGDYFIHRTGHSITTTDHGNGANIDNLETKELRPLIPRTCFSLEPGIYQPEFGVRTEYNVLIMPDGKPWHVPGTDQQDLILVEV